MPKWFALEELQIMDDFTATNPMVLASLGGQPALPGATKVEDWGLERRNTEAEHGVARQRAGSVHR